MTAVLHTQTPTFSSSILTPESEDSERQGSVLAVLAAVLRKGIVGCSAEREEGDLMEIGWPTNVRHVAHVTFDRFHGFLGLPVEFEPDVPRRAPSASASVFGVSAESMQCSYDSRGNSVPTILLLMQRCLYAQGGLQAEGIFRINAENSQEEHVRGELNRGIVPNGIDVHCLAGLIKAWFRELPRGVLDSLTSEQVMQCQTEEEYDALVKLLPPTEAALLDWAINLMADVAQEEHYNKMNARNIAMVFAPNMTQMDDPLTALMYAVQVMNFLKTLIERTLKEREEAVIESASASHSDPFDENEHHSPSRLSLEAHTEEETERIFVSKEPIESHCLLPTDNLVEKNDGIKGPRLVCASNFEGTAGSTNGQQPYQVPTSNSLVKRTESTANGFLVVQSPAKCRRKKSSQSSNVKHKKLVKKANSHQAIRTATPTEKRGISIISRINSTAERVEAWR